VNGKPWVAAVLATLTTACLGPPPKHYDVTQDANCLGTTQSASCMQIQFVTTPDVRKQAAPDRLTAQLHYGVYKGGTVSGLGPGDSPRLYHGDTPMPVNLSTSTASYSIFIPNVPVDIEYQVLGFLGPYTLDSKGVPQAVGGDPVTLPTGSFPVTADEKTVVTVVMDFVR
jgi:hypothetical protein